MQAFYSGTNYNTASYPASNRACAISSGTASQNGRAVSTKRWNYNYLLPKKTITSDTDATPISDFTAPNWVMVSRSGSNPTAWSSSLADSSASNMSFVVGRYAYAIYDEGGLLDMNVAGYPSNTTTAQLANRSAVALADLTRIGLTQSQIDQIVVGETTLPQCHRKFSIIQFQCYASNELLQFRPQQLEQYGISDHR